MLKLRKILLCNYLYIFLFLSILILSFIRIKYIKEKVDITNKKIFVIEEYHINDLSLNLTLSNKIKIKAKYYFKDEKEKANFVKYYDLKDKIKIDYEVVELKKNNNKELFNYYKYLKNKNININILIHKISLVQKTKNPLYIIKNKIYRYIDSKKTSKYMKAFILGNNEIDKEYKKIYQKLGINHLFAISGMHISIFTMLFLKLFKLLKIDEDKRYILVSIILVFYMFLTSFSASITRAGVFFILLAINKIYYFYIKPINVLLLTVSLILFINPYFVLDIGFIYSSLISFFLIVYSNYLEDLSYFKSLLFVSIISLIVSFPITIYLNFEINILSFIFNLFYVPFVSIIFFPLLLINLILPIDFLISFLIFIMEYISKLVINFSIFLTFKKIFIFVIFYYLLILLFTFTKFKKIVISLFIGLVLLHSNINYLYHHSNLYMIDISQGDSFLLYDNYEAILIDTGGVFKSKTNQTEDILIPLFKSLGIKKINKIIITHGDFDHLGNSYSLVDKFKVDKVYFNHNSYNKNELRLIEQLKKKKIDYEKMNSIKTKNFYLENLNYMNTDNENDASLVINIRYKNKYMLFMGDASIKTEKYLLNTYNFSNIDVLKVGHHGSITSTSEEFLKEIRPKIGLISCALVNKFKHPSNEVIKRLKKYNITLYQTRYDGGVKINLDS